jgi:hypothetical protein
VEDGLAATGTDVDEHPVILEPGTAGDLRDEVEHPLCLLRGELGDVTERVHVPLREDEQVRLRLRVDVADGDEAVGLRDVVAFLYQLAEETALLRQRGSPPA